MCVATVLREAKTLKSLSTQATKSVVTLGVIEKICRRIKNTILALGDKRLLWSVITMLFMGSFRPLEALCIHRLEYDEARTFTLRDIELVETLLDEEHVKFLQLSWKRKKGSFNSF